MKLEYPVRKWRGSFSLVLVGTTCWREAGRWVRASLGAEYCASRCQLTRILYNDTSMAEVSPSPSPKLSTSNVYPTGNEPARPYSEYAHFEHALLS